MSIYTFVCVCVYKEINKKELAHMIIEAKQSKVLQLACQRTRRPDVWFKGL